MAAAHASLTDAASHSENCHSFFTQVGRCKVAGLDEYTALAKEQYEEHLALYVRATLKRALGRLHVRLGTPCRTHTRRVLTWGGAPHGM
jgi:hypothetical protein